MHAVGELQRLPPELLVQIFILLDTGSLLACRQACHGLRSLIYDDRRLQYKYELSIAALEETGSVGGGGINLIGRLAMLRSYRAAWNSFQPRVERYNRVSPSLGWSIRDGVMGKLAATGSDNMTFTYSFDCVPSPSRCQHHTAASWELFVGQFPAAHAFFPSQDLLVAVRLVIGLGWGSHEYRVYLHTLSDFKEHPEAHLSFLSCQNVVIMGDACASSVEVCGNYVSVLFVYRRSGTWLRVWNWKTSQLVLFVQDSAVVSATFLNPDYIITTCVRLQGRLPCSLQVFAILSHPSDDTPDAAHPLPVLELVYPPMSPNCFPLEHSLRSDPSPEWSRDTRDNGPASPITPPFRISRSARLIVVTLRATPIKADGTNGAETFWILVPSAAVEALLPALSTNPDEPRVVQWAQWGPNGTRMFHSKTDSSSMMRAHAAFGMRWVGPRCEVSTEGPRAEVSCRVYDFNPWGLAKPLQSPSTTMDESAKSQAASTVLAAPEIVNSWVFLDRVTTHLPGTVYDVVLPIGESINATREVVVGLWEDGFILRQYSTSQVGILCL